MGKSSKPDVKKQVLLQFLTAFVKSKGMNVFVLTIIAALIASLTRFWQPLLVPIIFAIIFYKRLVFEILVIFHSIESSFGQFNWHSVADDNLLLGAVPLYETHFQYLSKKLGITAVLSVMEPFELTTSTLVGRPVTPTEWKKENIEQLILSCPDFKPPTFKSLDEGAAFINSHLIQNKRVYCHCKSGVGRSASVVMAYFMRYKVRIDLIYMLYLFHAIHTFLVINRMCEFCAHLCFS
jgi:protein-tyrosine phosphatase